MISRRKLTQREATARAAAVTVAHYDITLDLSEAVEASTFLGQTVVRFSCRDTAASTVIDVAAQALRSVVLNGVPVDLPAWSRETGRLTLSGLAPDNVLRIEGDFVYSTTGQGLHRLVDPTDGQTYLYTQLCVDNAPLVFACFDQPDLKAEFTWHVTVPTGWLAVSNMPVEACPDSGQTVHFARSPRMSTYVAALCAGPFHAVHDTHRGVDLGLYCRAAAADDLDSDDLLLITKQGLDFYSEQLGLAYPLPKYDQVMLPEFNAGGMENFGCVVYAESLMIFRAHVTDADLERRAMVQLHELAHMWFGDLVTLRWWDDLWLNESFAEWSAFWACETVTRFTDAWSTFLAGRKQWGYEQDQLSSTHPVYAQAPDVRTAELNFDGITYAKGAAVLKQLVAYVGLEAFLSGVRRGLKPRSFLSGHHSSSLPLPCWRSCPARSVKNWLIPRRWSRLRLVAMRCNRTLLAARRGGYLFLMRRLRCRGGPGRSGRGLRLVPGHSAVSVPEAPCSDHRSVNLVAVPENRR